MSVLLGASRAAIVDKHLGTNSFLSLFRNPYIRRPIEFVYIYIIYIYIYIHAHIIHITPHASSLLSYRNQVCLPLVSVWNLEVFKAEKFQKCDDKINESYDSLNKYLENTTA